MSSTKEFLNLLNPYLEARQQHFANGGSVESAPDPPPKLVKLLFENDKLLLALQREALGK